MSHLPARASDQEPRHLAQLSAKQQVVATSCVPSLSGACLGGMGQLSPWRGKTYPEGQGRPGTRCSSRQSCFLEEAELEPSPEDQ